VAQKLHFAILRIEVTRASRGVSAIAELLVTLVRFALLRMRAVQGEVCCGKARHTCTLASHIWLV